MYMYVFKYMGVSRNPLMIHMDIGLKRRAALPPFHFTSSMPVFASAAFVRTRAALPGTFAVRPPGPETGPEPTQKNNN